MAATNISTDESALLARKVHITINPDSFLVYLNLGYNNFHGLFEGMTRLRSLRYIFLNNNFFSGRIPVWFISQTSASGSTRKLLFTGSIPNSIFNSSSLEHVGLSLSFNLFPGNIPREIGKLKSLEMLDIGRNNFHGNSFFFVFYYNLVCSFMILQV